jgi:hypothetical protein
MNLTHPKTPPNKIGTNLASSLKREALPLIRPNSKKIKKTLIYKGLLRIHMYGAVGGI